jgi:hypothetical protein
MENGKGEVAALLCYFNVYYALYQQYARVLAQYMPCLIPTSCKNYCHHNYAYKTRTESTLSWRGEHMGSDRPEFIS